MGDIAERARAGRRAVLPQDPEIRSQPGSALEWFEHVAWGEIWQRSGLSMREKRLVTLTVLGLNGTERTLGLHLRGALDSGDLTEADLDALLLHFGAYAGLPRASALAAVLARVLQERTRPEVGQA